MSPLARPLLALAAAALLHGAAGFGDSPQCTTVNGGSKYAHFTWMVMDEHIVQKDNVIDLPPDRCPPSNSHMVGVQVTACDPFGPPPGVTLMNDDKRVRIRCTWGQGQTCPEGLNIKVTQLCNWK